MLCEYKNVGNKGDKGIQCLSFFVVVVVGIVNQNQSETVIYVQHPITL